MIRRTPSRGSGSCTGSSSLCVSNPRTVFPHCAAYRAQGKATSGAIMRALTGCAHAGYAALHVREMLSHGDSDPLHVVAQFIAVCSASNLAEARCISSLLQGSSLAKTRAFSRPSRAHGHHLRPSTNCYKLSENFHIPPDLVVDQQASDGESSSNHVFLFL